MRYRFGGLIFGGAYTLRGLFSEFYGTISVLLRMHVFIYSMVQGAHNGAKTSFFSVVYLLSSECQCTKPYHFASYFIPAI